MSTKYRSPVFVLVAVVGIASSYLACIAAQDGLESDRQTVRDIYEELIEINTVTDKGDTARAADAMAKRLLDAGFAKEDVRVFKPVPRKGNLVARLRGDGSRRPMLLMAHLDVVEALREDWSTDPFELVEKDGYFYARGSNDDKLMAASFVANLIRYKQQGYRPARDLILVLETDEETFDRDGHGIQWLLANQRDLIDAEFAINEGGAVGAVGTMPLLVAVQDSEKATVNFVLETHNRGGHSSQPRKDNAIYELASALTKVEAFQFPISLNDTTRPLLALYAGLQPPPLNADLKLLTTDGVLDDAAVARLLADPTIGPLVHSTCVATLLQAGHAYNALPQTARATLNCRLLPGESPEDTLATLRQVVANDQLTITQDSVFVPSDRSPITPEFMRAIEKLRDEFWPKLPITAYMTPGASDATYLRNAGIPTYGFSAVVTDITDVRDHGRDERVLVTAFYGAHEALYKLVKDLASPEPANEK
jgi:acetylornithine deacetylase/succinyl-diaminopimelate desuccinylase-like protein